MKIKIIKFLFFLSLISLCGFTINNNSQLPQSTWVDQKIQIIKSQANTIDLKVLRLGLTAYAKAEKQGFGGRQILTVIDYSKPSSQKRLWVIDLQTGRTLFNTWVSHGKNSGDVNSTSFSNRPGSLKSALGVFVTGNTYVGKNGYSLHMRGLEPGINNNSYDRSIVIHGASYVNPDIIRRYGRIGRSWGCPAVSTSLSKPLINAIKGKSLIFAYYPDRNWLSHSQFLKL